jgi:lipoprotein-releasing system ATP-binding protein
MNNNLFSCTRLNKTFNQGLNHSEVISDLDFSMDQGTTLALLGPSGCGKTTLLHLLAGLDTPTSGEIKFLNNKFSLLNSNERAQMRIENIGFVYQFHHLLPEFSAQENIALPMMMKGYQKEESMQRASDLLVEVNLINKNLNKPGELSGGERQRVAIARAMANKPTCLLMDEPTGDLDQANAKIITDLILSLASDHGISLLVATHDMTLADRLDKVLNLALT